MGALLDTDEPAAEVRRCHRCCTPSLRTYHCAACGDRRNRQVARRMGRWWGALTVTTLGSIALFLVAASLHERSRLDLIAAREARLVGVRAEQAAVANRIDSTASATAIRRKAGIDLIKREPRFKKQLATATADAARLRTERDGLRSTIEAGVLAPGASI